MKCQFCGKYNEDDISITDGETQQEVLICKDCEELSFFKIPNKIKEIDGYEEMTIQELEKKIDEVVDCEIEYLKENKNG